MQSWSKVYRRAAESVLAMLVFALTLSAVCGQRAIAQTYTVLYNFTGDADGAGPNAGLILDPAGHLYGTAAYGGSLNGCGGVGCGVVFRVDMDGNESVLYSFTGGTDGAAPRSSVIQDSAGNLYGTTQLGGQSNPECDQRGCGTVFKLDRADTESVLHSFTGMDGANSVAALTRSLSGHLLYGITFDGGNSNYGVVFAIDKEGKEKVLHSFSGVDDGGYPYGGVTQDTAGNLYSTTAIYNGLTEANGSVFKLDDAGLETALHDFRRRKNGITPEAGLILDAAGNLYGTTAFGGSYTGPCTGYGCGVVFKLGPDGSYAVLHIFTGGLDGITPVGSLLRDSAGSLYGATIRGGAAGMGTIFKIDPQGNETVLHNFAGQDGSGPTGSLAQDGEGNLYGTTGAGGTSGSGVVFMLTPLRSASASRKK